MSKQTQDEIIKYINEVAELYGKSKKAKEAKDEKAVKSIEKEIANYRKQGESKTITYADMEETFSYLVSTTTGISAFYSRSIESKLSILLNLLKQQGTISGTTYDSVMKQYRAIDRDYHVDEGVQDGNTKTK